MGMLYVLVGLAAIFDPRPLLWLQRGLAFLEWLPQQGWCCVPAIIISLLVAVAKTRD